MKLLPLVSLAAIALAGTATQVAQAQSPAPQTAAPAPTAAAPASAAIPPWGFDLSGMDTSVTPGNDWVRFTSGKWLDTHEIPADRSNLSNFSELRETARKQVQDLITAAPAGNKYGDFYRSFMDEAQAEKLGVTPIQADLATIAAIPDKVAFSRFMGTTARGLGISLIDIGIDADTADPTMNALWVTQGGIGMPDRDYYLKADFAGPRAAYVAYMERTFARLGNPDPKGAAAKVMALETRFAQVSWDNAARRSIEKINNPMSTAQLAAYAPGLDWNAYFAGAQIPAQNRMIVNENTAIRDLAKIYAETPLETLKLWQTFHWADAAAPYLDKQSVDSRFEYSKTLSGVTENEARWKRGVSLVSSQMGELIGKDYVAKFFPPEAKAKMEQLVANVKLAMAGRISGNSWMSQPTKDAALLKLSKMDVMVGYPDKWRDFSSLTIVPTDLYGNVKRATAFNANYALQDLGKPVDRRKWAMSPQTVNAYNGGLENKIVFPAAILQPPFFDPKADDAVNYGAIGGVIGHEISHGFDDQGRKIDANGKVRDWWTPEDAARFEAQAKVFGAQYAQFEVAPGAFVNPALTMGENIADFAGIQVALDAYHKSLGGKPAPVLDGYTGDQRVFLAWGQVWRGKQREAALRDQVTTDPHSPTQVRAIAPLRNVDAWYGAFSVKPGDKHYIAPEDRARIW